jgi:hypothetical protein
MGGTGFAPSPTFFHLLLQAEDLREERDYANLLARKVKGVGLGYSGEPCKR